MQLSHLLGAGALIAVISVWMRSDMASPIPTQTSQNRPANVTETVRKTPPTADGHFAIVVEGDRNGLAVTFASKKTAPWAGAPKGFDSNWHVTILDALGNKLASVPLDVRPFATGANSVGKPVQVRGCVVVDSKIGMLVNVPAYAAAASYVFARTEVDGVVTTLGTTSGDVIRELARGGR